MSDLRTAVLGVLNEREPMDAGSVIFAIEAMDWIEATPRAREIVNMLESLAKSGEVSQTWSHQSLFRRRTEGEFAELIEVRAGTQRELL